MSDPIWLWSLNQQIPKAVKGKCQACPPKRNSRVNEYNKKWPVVCLSVYHMTLFLYNALEDFHAACFELQTWNVFFLATQTSCCKKLYPFLALTKRHWHLRFTNNRRGDVELGPCRDFILGRKKRPILANSLVALGWEKGTQPKWI